MFKNKRFLFCENLIFFTKTIYFLLEVWYNIGEKKKRLNCNITTILQTIRKEAELIYKKGGMEMKITTVGRQMDVPRDLKELFETKLLKFDKFFKDEAEAVITISRKKNLECLELMITANGTLFRSEESDTTFRNALDKAVDTIERQIRKNKTRLEKKFKGSSYDIEAFLGEDYDVEEEGEFEIRTKTFSFKPMSVEEAILQMNLLRHEFFVFTNMDTDDVNVVYKRKNGGYGLIVPG